MNKKEKFIEEIEKFIESKQLSEESIEYFRNVFIKEKEEKTPITENGKKIIEYVQANWQFNNNIFTSKSIGAGIGISSRSVSGSIRKLVTDKYIKKIGSNPSSYSLTDLGKNLQLDKE